MDPQTVASATTLLTYLGLGKYVAGILSLIALAGFIAAHVMPYLPVATATSSGWYRVLYGAVRMATGNYLRNAPTPNAQAVAAIAGVPPSTSTGNTTMTRSLILAFAVIPALTLAACSGTGATVQTATIVAKVQADYPVLKAALATYAAQPGASAAVKADIAKGETYLDPAVAGLSGVVAPTSVKTVVADMNALVADLPAGTLKPALQADIVLLLALANAGLVTAG